MFKQTGDCKPVCDSANHRSLRGQVQVASSVIRGFKVSTHCVDCYHKDEQAIGKASHIGKSLNLSWNLSHKRFLANRKAVWLGVGSMMQF